MKSSMESSLAKECYCRLPKNPLKIGHETVKINLNRTQLRYDIERFVVCHNALIIWAWIIPKDPLAIKWVGFH
jgi:hypothetical protein